jgi:nitrite reductase/ring-hydroxylating ferredoxin subunit
MSAPHDSGAASPGDTTDCTDCPLSTSRRDFLGSSLSAVAAAMASLGLSRRAYAKTVVRHVRALTAHGAMHSYAIPEADGAHIDSDNDVILVRWEHAVYAFNLSCPHQNTALRWNNADHRFQCPRHKSKYRPNGEFIEGRATRGMDRLAIKRDGANVVVDLDVMFKQDVDPAGWNAAVVAASA